MSISMFDQNYYTNSEAQEWAIKELNEKYSNDLSPLTIFQKYIQPNFSNATLEALKPSLEHLCEQLSTYQRHISQHEIDEYLETEQCCDYQDEMMNLKHTFDHIDCKYNPSAGNKFIITGAIQKWNGTHEGIQIENDFSDIFKSNGVFKDCKISAIDVDGYDIIIKGYHHDGNVSIKARQLTNKGQKYLDLLEYDELPEDGITIDNKQFNSENQANDFLSYLFANYTENIENIFKPKGK